MSKKRDINLDKYGISRNKYRELYYFCLQYKEFIREKNSCYTLDGHAMDNMPKGNHISDPTAKKAEKALKLEKDIKIIEQSAIEAAPEYHKYLLRAVTEGLSFDIIYPPCGKEQFKEAKRKFFCALYKRKQFSESEQA